MQNFKVLFFVFILFNIFVPPIIIGDPIILMFSLPLSLFAYIIFSFLGGWKNELSLDSVVPQEQTTQLQSTIPLRKKISYGYRLLTILSIATLLFYLWSIFLEPWDSPILLVKNLYNFLETWMFGNLLFGPLLYILLPTWVIITIVKIIKHILNKNKIISGLSISQRNTSRKILLTLFFVLWFLILSGLVIANMIG